MEEEAWKSLGEEWAHPHAQRSFAPDEDYRAGDGFSPGPGMSSEQMLQYRMSEYGALRRGDPRAGQAPGGAEFYNSAGNGAGYPGAARDEMGRPSAEMLRAMNEGSGHGMAMQAPNLANTLQNTTLGNYLTTEARAVSAAHRQVLVKVVCNYRRTDDLNPGGRPSPPEATHNRCKTILAFQEGNGTHLCFGMFVKEYSELAQVYIDSVDSTPLLEGENGEDRQKTMTSIVLAYMNHAKLRGFKRLYLRVAPPTDENSFIFTRRLPNVRFRASMHLSLWFKYIVQAASRNGIVHSSKWSTSAVELEFPTWMLREDDHHAEEAYRAMTASLVQAQQGAKDLVEVANRLQDRFFCVYLHNPSAKVKNVDDDGITVESEAMRDRMSFAEVCVRQHLRFNVGEASAKSSRVLIGMISAEQQRSPAEQPGEQQQQQRQMKPNQDAQHQQQLEMHQQQQQQQQQQQKQMMAQQPMHHDGRREGSGQMPPSLGGGSEEARQNAALSAGYVEGEQMSAGRGGLHAGRGKGSAASTKDRPTAGGRGVDRQSELEMYKDMEGQARATGRGMGPMSSGMVHGGGHHPADFGAFYGYPSHMDSMMSGGYLPAHRMPYAGMHAGYPPDMYHGAIEDMKGAHGKHGMAMAHGMPSHLQQDARWADPRMAGRGMWQHQHPSAARDVMRSMALSGRYGRGEGVDPRMVDAHGFDFDPSYSGHIGQHMQPSAHEMQMLHAMAGGSGVPSWGGGMPGAMPRKAPAGAGLVAAGRPGQADAGAKAGAGKRRGNGEGPGTPVANMQQGGMLPGYGGPGDEASAAMYAEDMLLQEQFELRAADRKRGFGQMAASPDEREQGGGESSENEAAKGKRVKIEQDTKEISATPAEAGPPAAASHQESPGIVDIKAEAGEEDEMLELQQEQQALQQQQQQEADSFLAAPQV